MKTMKSPETANILFHQHNAANEIRDIFLKLLIFDRRALKFAAMAQRASSKAWKIVGEAYPETKNGDWHWDCAKESIVKGVKK